MSRVSCLGGGTCPFGRRTRAWARGSLGGILLEWWSTILSRRALLLVAALFCAAPAPSPAPEASPVPVEPGPTGQAPARVELGVRSLASVRAGLPSGTVRSEAADPGAEPSRYVPVTTAAPDIRVESPAAPNVLEQVRGTPGVARASLVRVARVPVGAGGDSLVVASVDPPEYRSMAPQVTADELGVWQRLDEGALVVMHEHAERLALDLGGTVRLGGEHGPDLRVGAVASNGVPPVAEAIVDRATGARLGLDAVPATILVVTDEGVTPTEVAGALQEVAAEEVNVVPDPRAPVGVTPAAPAGSTVWDVLAMCESSGDWQANTGNGFYGGLQFLPESWALVGGRGLPHEASREEQIHRAERLLERQGWRAWPVCSVRVGLRAPDEG